jgi:CheY-like chemotaxis protein
MRSEGEILLVEDDREIRELLVDALEDAGYSVVAAEDGLDALEQLRARAEVPRLMLLDLMMPNMNGCELRAELSREPAWSQIPFIVLSSHAGVAEKGAALGARESLRKPVRVERLFEAVDRVLGRARAPAPVPSVNSRS